MDNIQDTNQDKIQNTVDATAQDSQYTVSPIPYHTHNGADSPLINVISLSTGTPLRFGVGEIISTTNNKAIGAVDEQLQTIIGAGRDLSGTIGTTSANLQMNFLHQPQNAANQSFIVGARPPIFLPIVGTTISTTLGGTTVTITGYGFAANSLAGALIDIVNSAGVFIETQTIASNTDTVVTIVGTWLATTSGGTFLIFQPVFFGSAQQPWQRFYTQEGTGAGIRFGVGVTNGGQNGLIYMDSVGDIYWRNKAGTSTKLNVTAGTDLQTFSGVGGTWTKPAGAKFVQVICVGGGGGGCGGKLAPGSGTGPSAGGAGGAVTINAFSASILGATETVTVGGQANGGGGVSANGDGGAGTNGTTSTFGTWCQAGGGGGGSGSGSSSGGLGGGGGGSLTGGIGRIGGTPTLSNSNTTGNVSPTVPNSAGTGSFNSEYAGAAGDGGGSGGGSSIFAGAGGGCGGVGSNSGTAFDGGTVGAYTAGGASNKGTNSSSAPTNGTAGRANSVLKKGYGGEGGGGGGGTATGSVTCGNGGDGGFPGGGGGGGGCNNSGQPNVSGNGGKGGAGQIIVMTYF